MVDFPAVPLVVDMSHGDGVTSFAQAKAGGVAGIIHKATTGATGHDDAYDRRKGQARAAGLLWGAYHWGTAAPIAAQVKNFLDWSGARDDPAMLLSLDFESTPGNQMTLALAKDFLTRVTAEIGRRPIIYSGDTLKTALGNTVDPFFEPYRLWLAQYGPTPRTQKTWARPWLWQYTDGAKGPGPKKAPGIVGDRAGRTDCNWYDGNAVKLALEWA
jgi:GH25 family lysozyme M1 (1,4-beta-N-acetylmuramidase)